MNSEKRLKHIIQKYPEIMYSLSTTLSRKHPRGTATKLERVLRYSMERSSRCRATRRPPGRLVRLVVSEALSCVLCSRVYHSPVTLECGDTFCRGCLPEKTPMMTCPLCGRYAPLEAVRCNVLLQDIVTRLAGDTQDSGTRTKESGQISHNYTLRKRADASNIKQNDHETVTVSAKRKCEDNDSGGSSGKIQKIDNSAASLTKALEVSCDGKVGPSPFSKFPARCLTCTDVECVLCGRCFYEPVTTSCGHTFCRSCLARVLDYGLACPLCMTTLGGSGAAGIGVCHALDTVIQRLLPGDYAERATAHQSEIQAVDEDEQIPVFICTSAFPGVACPLYVYEPRYRLLTRRCLQTSRRRFAMAAAAAPISPGGLRTTVVGLKNERFASYGTVLEVRDALHLQDGTSILTTIGLRRFRVVARGEKDGYDTARVEYIRDHPVQRQQLASVRALHDRVHRKATRWVRSLSPHVHAEVEQSLGAMPPLEPGWASLPDGPSWAWWLMPVLPLSAHLQLGFLSTLSLEKRLRAIDKLLDRMSVRMRARERSDVGCGVTTSAPAEADDVEFSSGESCNHHSTTERRRVAHGNGMEI